MGGTVYILDANIWIDAHERAYPPDLFPSVWDHLKEAAESGEIKTPRQVISETGDGKKGVSAWIRLHGATINLKETPRVQKRAGEILGRFPGLVSPTSKDSADPWVIAFALELGYTVATSEKPTQSRVRPKIPNVCDAYGVKWVSLLDLLRALGLRL